MLMMAVSLATARKSGQQTLTSPQSIFPAKWASSMHLQFTELSGVRRRHLRRWMKTILTKMDLLVVQLWRVGSFFKDLWITLPCGTWSGRPRCAIVPLLARLSTHRFGRDWIFPRGRKVSILDRCSHHGARCFSSVRKTKKEENIPLGKHFSVGFRSRSLSCAMLLPIQAIRSRWMWRRTRPRRNWVLSSCRKIPFFRVQVSQLILTSSIKIDQNIFSPKPRQCC